MIQAAKRIGQFKRLVASPVASPVASALASVGKEGRAVVAGFYRVLEKGAFKAYPQDRCWVGRLAAWSGWLVGWPTTTISLPGGRPGACGPTPGDLVHLTAPVISLWWRLLPRPDRDRARHEGHRREARRGWSGRLGGL